MVRRRVTVLFAALLLGAGLVGAAPEAVAGTGFGTGVVTGGTARSHAQIVAVRMARHLHFEPWLSWREDRVIPFLATLAGHVRDELASLVGRVMRQHRGPGAHRESIAAWETALSFDAWHRLARGHRLSRPAVRRAILHCLRATAPPQAPKPVSRSKT